MFLSRFRVRGYKCLEDVDIPLTPFHAIVGPNGCGKSSLLEAISALYGRLKTSPAQWFPAAESPRDWLTHDSNVPTIDLAGQWSERTPDGRSALAAGYGLSIVVPTTGHNLAVMDQWVRPRATDDQHSGLARKAFAYPHAASNSTAEDRAAQAAFRDVVQPMLQPAPVYRLDARRLAEPVAAAHEERRSLDADGYGLAAVLQDIAARHAERFTEIEAEFSRLAPMYCGLSFKMEPSKIKRKPPRGGKTSLETAVACALWLKTFSGRQVAAREASSGTMLLLALATLARLPEPPTLLLIENPEHGIHLPLMDDVIGSLRKLTQGSEGRTQVQVIVSTHSPAVQSLFEPQETTLLSRPEERPDGPVVAKPLAGSQ